MKTLLLLALITLSEATIGVFVKLTDGEIPIQTLNFYAVTVAAVFLMATIPAATGSRLRFPSGNVKDTVVIGFLIALQISVFNYAMTLVPIANAVIFWSVAPFFTFIFSALFLGEKARLQHVLIFAVAIVGFVLAKPLQGGYMFGNLVALADGAIYAAMVTYMRHEGKTETGNDIAWSMAAAALFLAPFLFIDCAQELERKRLRARRHHRLSRCRVDPWLPDFRGGAGCGDDLWRGSAARGRLLADPDDVLRRRAGGGPSLPVQGGLMWVLDLPVTGIPI